MKQRTAMLSGVSNSALILLKIVAGTLTGSVAILTEAPAARSAGAARRRLRAGAAQKRFVAAEAATAKATAA